MYSSEFAAIIGKLAAGLKGVADGRVAVSKENEKHKYIKRGYSWEGHKSHENTDIPDALRALIKVVNWELFVNIFNDRGAKVAFEGLFAGDFLK